MVSRSCAAVASLVCSWRRHHWSSSQNWNIEFTSIILLLNMLGCTDRMQSGVIVLKLEVLMSSKKWVTAVYWRNAERWSHFHDLFIGFQRIHAQDNGTVLFHPNYGNGASTHTSLNSSSRRRHLRIRPSPVSTNKMTLSEMRTLFHWWSYNRNSR